MPTLERSATIELCVMVGEMPGLMRGVFVAEMVVIQRGANKHYVGRGSFQLPGCVTIKHPICQMYL